MSTQIDKPAAKSLSVQAIVFTEIIWAVLAVLFFLLFSVADPGKDRPAWYSYGTSVFELVAYLTAAILCFRNWRSPQIVSGRKVWFGIGMGMLCYFLGGILFTFWETFLGRNADVSPGDFFYVPTYLFLGWGMVMAFADRRLNLEVWQWGIVAGIAAISIAFATWLTIAPEKPLSADLFRIAPVSAQTTATPAKPKVKAAQVAPKPIQTPKVQPSPATQSVTSPQTAPLPGQKTTPISPEVEQKATPAWVSAVEDTLAPLKLFLNYFYVVADVFILIVATTLLLAFWGGRFSQSWRMIAAAAFSLYVADMWFKYATARLENYQSGGLLEIFWVLSGVLFGIGAALEFDLSRSRRSGGRRRA
ncbi:MAG: hypothetical protein LH660_21145 [Phormidesmis sp. CAN_BIN36]|nr:hypothetical protein [Phormidesmis sp. CAN_BIN36]